jgi:hypothetical protein
MNYTEPEFEEKLAELIPVHCQNGLRSYVLNGNIPGGFLQAVICNNLKEAVSRADDVNVKVLPNYVMFLYNYVPDTCWGSSEAMKAWKERGGLVGKEETNELVK